MNLWPETSKAPFLRFRVPEKTATFSSFSLISSTNHLYERRELVLEEDGSGVGWLRVVSGFGGEKRHPEIGLRLQVTPCRTCDRQIVNYVTRSY